MLHVTCVDELYMLYRYARDYRFALPLSNSPFVFSVAQRSTKIAQLYLRVQIVYGQPYGIIEIDAIARGIAHEHLHITAPRVIKNRPLIPTLIVG